MFEALDVLMGIGGGLVAGFIAGFIVGGFFVDIYMPKGRGL